MSSKLAKVLLICALCVALPLFIAGTVIAVYYSMNAVTNVYVYSNGKYVEAPTITSSAKVEKGEETLGAPQYRVINGHSKTTTVDFEGEGYNFEFWFKGSHQEYVEILGRLSEAEKGEDAEEISAIQSELDGKKISLSAPLSIKTGNYEDITAVFSVVTYTVKYDNNTYTFEYGEPLFSSETTEGKLPLLPNTDTQDFVGYVIAGSDVVYTTATFPATEGEVELVAKFMDKPTLTVNYLKDGESVGEYKDITEKNYTSHSVPSVNGYKDNGYTAKWMLNGTEFTGVTEEMINNLKYGVENVINVTLEQTPIEYTVVVSGNAPVSAEYTKNKTFKVNIENYSALNNLTIASDWRFGADYEMEFVDFKYNNGNPKTVDALIEAIVEKNPNSAPESVTVIVNFARVAENYNFEIYGRNGNSIGTVKANYNNNTITLPSGVYEYGYKLNSSASVDGQACFVDGYDYTYTNGVLGHTVATITLPKSVFEGDTNKRINLSYSTPSYSIQVSGDYKGGSNVIDNITKDTYTTKLAPLFSQNNWLKYINIQEWNGTVSANGYTFKSAKELFDYLLYRDNSARLTVTGDVECIVSKVVINGVLFTEAGVELADGQMLVDNPATRSITDLNMSIYDDDALFGYDLINAHFFIDNEEVEPSFIYFDISDRPGSSFDFADLAGDYSIYNFVEQMIQSNAVKKADIVNGTLTLSNIQLNFATIL